METPGLLLKREREARGLTIAELARITRISETALENIEKNAFDEFPAQVFVRGFLRNYARQLSIPAEEIMESYDAWMRQSKKSVCQFLQLCWFLFATNSNNMEHLQISYTPQVSVYDSRQALVTVSVSRIILRGKG